jgi:hypothetical protein
MARLAAIRLLWPLQWKRSCRLVGLTVIVTVPAQRLPDGRPAPHGIEAEELELLTIDGTSMVARL